MNAYLRLFVVASLTGTAAWSAAPMEKKITRKELPAAVAAAVAAESKGAKVKGFKREIEDGKTFYEAELVVAGHTKDILFDETGAMVEAEEEVSFDGLPQPVKDGLTKAAAGGKLGKVESLTKKGVLKAYEAVVKTGKKKSEVQVGPDGNPLAKPE